MHGPFIDPIIQRARDRSAQAVRDAEMDRLAAELRTGRPALRALLFAALGSLRSRLALRGSRTAPAAPCPDAIGALE